jgi:D-psicose/D-tagatose/L-ribulose 3-epimerase
VTIGVEAVNRYESNLVNTAEQALELVEEVGAPNLVVHLDAYHMNIEEANLADPVRMCAERLGYVHIGESHRGYLAREPLPSVSSSALSPGSATPGR